MGDSKAIVKMFNLVTKGLVLGVDPRLLTDGQLQDAKNIVVLQEGSLSVRAGAKYRDMFSHTSLLTQIRKLRVSDDDSSNIRYCGVVTFSSSYDIARTIGFSYLSYVAYQVADLGDAVSKRFSMASYSAGATGNPWAFFACPKKMLKDNGNAPYSTLKTWGILPAAGVATAVDSGAGLLDGGDTDSPSGSLPYKYRYTYKSASTGNESNPSQEMLSNSSVPNGTPIAVHLRQVTVTVWGCPDPTEFPTIVIYRSGGVVSDGLYHKVGVVANPGMLGAFPAATTFVDNIPDSDAVYGDPLQENNDPPIPSTLPSPYSVPCPTISGTGFQAISLPNVSMLTPGSQLHVLGGSQETVTILSIDASGVVIAYFQSPHSSAEKIECYTAVGSPAGLCCSAFDSVFVAGDPNNPHALYKSKTGFPESFPIRDASGRTHVINVGTPSNHIVNICEFNGTIACLNVSSIFQVQVWNGEMQAPIETPANRGLYPLSPWAFCKGNNEIYYLSYDGIYSWSGGMSTKRSVAIDPLFQGRRVGSGSNPVHPVDYSPSAIQYCTMDYHNGKVYFSYRATDGSTNLLVYDTINDRWLREEFGGITTIYNEEDTGELLIAQMYGSSSYIQVVAWDVDGTSDPILGVGTLDQASDDPVRFKFRTGFYDLGDPSLVKLVTAIYVDLENPQNDITVRVFYDYDDTTVSPDTFTIPAADNKISHLACIPLNPGGTTPGAESYGKECRSIALEFSSDAGVSYRATFHSIGFEFTPVEVIRRGGNTEYSNLGYDGDKKLYVLKLTYDTGGDDSAHIVTLHLDTRTGIDGKTENLSVQSWYLSNLGKTSVSLPLNDDPRMICKLVRLRTDVAPNDFRFWQWEFVKEDYPPDIIYHTPLDDSGYPFNKYYQSVNLDVDTGGVEASVVLEVDGKDVATFSVNTTATDRRRNITVGPNIVGRKARIRVTPGTGGKFQLFSVSYGVGPADKGQVAHTFDWDALGWPWDKRLKTVTIEYEVTQNSSVTVEGLNGIAGNQTTYVITTIPLYAGGRKYETIAMPNNTIVKMVRLYPSSTNVDFKEWKYTFDQENYPADNIPATPLEQLGWPWEKILRAIVLKVDTGGVAANVSVEVDGVVRQTWSVTTTESDRARILTPNSDIIGKMFRLIPSTGSGGKFQLFEWHYDVVREPAPLTHWDSYEQAFGYNGYKRIKQEWWEYTCNSPITISIYTDNGQFLCQKTLPAHPKRDVERFFLPRENSGVRNISKVYRHVVDSTSTDTFKIYSPSTRVEWMPHNADQRQGYQQTVLFTEIQLGEG